MILAEVTYVPIGTGTSASPYINAALSEFKKSGIKFYPNSMGTVLEASTLDEIFDVVKKGERAIINMGVKRVETYIKIDDRIDVENTAERKIKALKY